MTIPAFRIKRTAQAVALALAFGASIQVVQAANQTYCYLGIPGMGCNLPTTPGEGVDSTMVGSLPNPGLPPPPPSWSSGGNTIAGFLQENAAAGRAIYLNDEPMTSPFIGMNVGQITFTSGGAVMVPEAVVVKTAYPNVYHPPFSLPYTWIYGPIEATALSPNGTTGVMNVNYGGENQGGTNYAQTTPYAISLTPSSIDVGGLPSTGAQSCVFTQDLLNAGYNTIDFGNGYTVVGGANGTYAVSFPVMTGGGPPVYCGSNSTTPPAPSTSPLPPSCTCFPAGNLVMMADGEWRVIEGIRVGEYVMGADGKPAEVIGMELPILGDRKLMRMGDGSLSWSEEHLLWAKQGGKEWWWSANREIWKDEVRKGLVQGLDDDDSILEGRVEFAHMEGWVDREVEVIDAPRDLQLFLPVTRGVPIIVNGYLAEAWAHELTYDHKQFAWSPAVVQQSLDDAYARAGIDADLSIASIMRAAQEPLAA